MKAVGYFGTILAVSLAAAALAGGAAIGQVRQEQPVSALKGHNSNAPVDVTADRIEVHNRALDQTQMLVSGVGANQMALPTPCEEWDVRALLNHMVGGNRSYAGIARRNQRRRAPGEDILGDDPVEAYRQSARDCKQAWSDPRLLDEMLPSHLGESPGRMVTGWQRATFWST